MFFFFPLRLPFKPLQLLWTARRNEIGATMTSLNDLPTWKPSCIRTSCYVIQ